MSKPMYRAGAIRELVSAGLDEAQAEAIVDAIMRIGAARVEALPDRHQMRDDLLAASRIIRADIAASHRRTIQWVMALHALLLAVLVGIARFTSVFP